MENHIFLHQTLCWLTEEYRKMRSLLSCLIHLIELSVLMCRPTIKSISKSMRCAMMYEQKCSLIVPCRDQLFVQHQLNVFAIFEALPEWSFLSLNSWCVCRAWVELAAKTLVIIGQMPPDCCISVSSIVSIVSATLRNNMKSVYLCSVLAASKSTLLFFSLIKSS